MSQDQSPSSLTGLLVIAACLASLFYSLNLLTIHPKKSPDTPAQSVPFKAATTFPPNALPSR